VAGSSDQVLLDAVSRGMRAALVEQDDIAAGRPLRRVSSTAGCVISSSSSSVVREALAERSRLRPGPSLVRIEPLLFPIMGSVRVKAF
jgi:glycerol-3-phosphate dehydrogenase